MSAAVLNESSVRRREDVDAVMRDEMFSVFKEHFEGVARGQFERDLAEKSHVILIQRDGRLVGFSTLLVYETAHAGAPVSVVYSGDTIVTPEAWGTMALPRAWIAAVNRLRKDFPHGRYFWLLLTSGFRTYRFLPVFWREFFPRFDVTTPSCSRELLVHLARERFEQQFNEDSGVVRFSEPQCLRSQLSVVPAERLKDPHVKFFLSRNPGHAGGDELVCLTELTAQNLTAAGRRMTGEHEHARYLV
jgi:hypothetical protein